MAPTLLNTSTRSTSHPEESAPVLVLALIDFLTARVLPGGTIRLVHQTVRDMDDLRREWISRDLAE
ncbi:hypothetical protein DPMN_190270 [Dreissena polymorpha]|uniref:Uncharacterized protein n=1 Tax=Dreissena polymorpha TaxID=45954 RepID=A0A9D4DX14_DREPO|nr:hypothetical protein DPMN_190270 [Dreissena polymorpha]